MYIHTFAWKLTILPFIAYPDFAYQSWVVSLNLKVRNVFEINIVLFYVVCIVQIPLMLINFLKEVFIKKQFWQLKSATTLKMSRKLQAILVLVIFCSMVEGKTEILTQANMTYKMILK